MAEAKPITFNQAIKKYVWVSAMEEEIKSIEKNNTRELAYLPADKTPIVVKWVYKVKFRLDGSISKHKAKLVAKGYMQREGYDYSEVFAPVARFETVRLIVALSSRNNWKL
ncbi:PREDICTED: uncharacterized protein LOC109340318 [Lupinus angustifolius]|uniref:uncharacterized protein LOC109340318 n=1 Tax=Lupinus angustifolius TaxID=3871 RepID=UPI00092F9B55|nr:PREDICTED: uncharacterized protein LOC109340318 [Lupinus angustifolius]